MPRLFFDKTVTLYRLLLVAMTGALSLAVLSCENPEGALNPNSAPDTRIANVPANDTIALYLSQGAIPQQTLYWVGDDPDGFVIGFRYTWTDIYDGTENPTDTVNLLNLATIGGLALDTLATIPDITVNSPGAMFRIYNFLATLNPDDETTRNWLVDSLATLRPFLVPYPTGFIATDWLRGADPLFNEAPNKGIFIFDSPADSNMHRFEVWAIDNNEVIDPTPAKIHFWTLPSPGLTVTISAGPTTASAAYVLRYPTERTPGLLFGFTATDPSTNERDYSWAVDDTANWSPWNPQATATVTAIDFEETGSDTHTFFLRGRNKWGVESPIVNRLFRAIVPSIDDPNWPKKTLVINNSRLTNAGPPAWMPPVDTNMVNAFYREIMDSLGKVEGTHYDLWTTSARTAGGGYVFPDTNVLESYTSVLLLSEQDQAASGLNALTRLDPTVEQRILRTYLNIGGKLIFSGSPNILLTFGTPSSTTWPEFGDEIFHVLTDASAPPVPYTLNAAYDFVGSKGNLGYPDTRVDSAKLPATAFGAIKDISINFPRGFGQTICEFDSKIDSVGFEDQPLGVRYLAPPPIGPGRETYSVVYFGHPLYYVMKSDAIGVLRKAFADIKE